MSSSVSSSSVATNPPPSRRKHRSQRLRPSTTRFPRLRKSLANTLSSTSDTHQPASHSPIPSPSPAPTLNHPHRFYHQIPDDAHHNPHNHDDDNDDDRESLVPSLLQSVTTLPSHSSNPQQQPYRRYYQRRHHHEEEEEENHLLLQTRLRIPSRTSLRFALNPNLHSASVNPHLTHLFRLILHPVATHPPLTLYLSAFEPAANALHSLLVLAARSPLPTALHNALLFTAIHPHTATIPSPYRVAYPDRHSGVITSTNITNSDTRSSRKRRNSTGTGLNSMKDSVALHYVRAVAACPPRVSCELYRAMLAAYPPEKFDRVALIASLAAFYSSLVSLLGFVNNNENPLQSTNLDHFPFEQLHPFFIVDHSEVSAPSSTSSPSPPSSPDCPSPSSLSATRAARYRKHFHVTDSLRLRVSAHSSRHMQRSPWLSSFPTSRRSQLDYVRRRLGFVPRYLDSMTSSSQRTVFMYIIFNILLNKSPTGVSTVVKQLSCFILARATENATLTAHSAYTAHHYGADIRQMLAAVDIDYLKAKHRLSMEKNRTNLKDGDLASVARSVSSSLSSASPMRGVDAAQCRTSFSPDTDRWPADERPVHRRPRYRSLLFTALRNSRREASMSEIEGRNTVEQEKPMTEEHANCNVTERLLARASQIDELSDSESSLSDSSGRGVDEGLEQERFDDCNEVDDLDQQLVADGLPNVQRVHEIEARDLFDVANDNPTVPDVAGLNVLGGADGLDEIDSCADTFAMEAAPFVGSRERRRHGEPFLQRRRDFNRSDDYVSGYTTNGRGTAADLWSANDAYDVDLYYSEGDGTHGEGVRGENIFTEREIALLLVAHEVGLAWRRNWRRCEKIAGAQPLGLLPAELARDVQRLFADGEGDGGEGKAGKGIMEVCCVVSGFALLDRWTACREVRPVVLEDEMKCFARSDVGNRLGIAKVGQRATASEHSEGLRGDCRSLRLPRHAVVPPTSPPSLLSLM